MRIGHLLDVTARGTGAVVSYVLVAAILFSSSVRLGLVVIIGAPVFTLLVLPVMRPLERRQSTERFARSDASSLAADTVVGLRVLRGLGGEDVFSERYAVESQKVRRATVRTAIAQSGLDALQVFVPGALLVIVTYVGARMVLTSSLPVGKLVAFYAYAAFLTLPIQVLIEVATRWSAATVAAGRVLTVLRREPDLPRVDQPAPEPGRGPLFDPVTGLVIERGKFLVVAARDAEEGSQLAARLGRYVDDPAGAVRLNGTSLSDLDLGVVRRRILVIDREPQLLAGTLEANVDMPASRDAQARPSITEAIDDASATDIVAGLALGLDTELPERGRTLSGGQRQRIILAAALRADPDFLILDEPTSAVDAHTEAAIASGLRAARAGRTTVVISTSPFFLEHADAVAFIEGTEIAVGVHRDLLHLHPNYRALILREST
jgi:ABC-type multidrug transport system fused ATPase/permease subunit